MPPFSYQGADLKLDPLLMNAFNNVNLAASCILTSTEYAQRLGIPERKWIYPLGGAGTQDSDHCRSMFDLDLSNEWLMRIGQPVWERPNFYSSPAISRSLDACLEVSDLTKEAVDLIDLYS